MSQKKTPSEAVDSPTAWFAALERARLVGDAGLERLAVGHLKRLGVSVAFEVAINNPPRQTAEVAQ